MKQIYSPTTGVFKLMFKQKKRFEHIISKASFLTLLLLTASLLSAQNYCYFESSKNTTNTITPEAAIIEPLPDILQINDRIVEIIDNSDNLYLAIPQYNSTTTAFEMLVRRVNASGTQLWSNVYNIPAANGNVIPAAIHLSPDGNLLVAGTYRVGGQVDYDAFLMKITPQGNLLWQETYSGNVNGFDGWFAVTTSDVGNIYVSGATTNQGITPDFAVMGLTPNGQQMWLKQKDQFGQIDLAAQIEYLNGAVFSSGVTQQNETTWGLLNASYDAIDGTVQFETPVTASNNELYQIEKLIPDTENDLIHVVATHVRPTSAEFYLAKINTLTGQIVWESSEDLTAGSDARARSATIDENGNIYVVGYQKKQDTGRDITVEKYNQTGQKIWTKYYDSNVEDDEAYDIIGDNLGSLYLTGYGVEDTGDNKSYLTLKINTDGNEIWRKYYNGVYNDDDVAKRIELDNSNNILVSGTTKEGEDLRHTTVKYANDCTVELPQTEPFSSSIAFIENRGQLLNTDGNPVKEIKYISERVSPAHYFFDNQISLVLVSDDGDDSTPDQAHRVDMTLNTATDRNTSIYPLEKRSDYYNYYLGHIPEGRERVPLYKNLVHSNAFPNIDVQYAGKASGMAYSFVVKLGGNPSDISLKFSGQDGLSINGNGELVIGTSIGDIVLPEARAYQVNASGEVVYLSWTPDYEILGSQIGFDVESYDVNKDLIIEVMNDPESVVCESDNTFGIEYSTYYGHIAEDRASDITAATPTFGVVSSDLPGDVFITGNTRLSFVGDGFPTINGAVDEFQGLSSAFVISIDGLARDWVTFFGGNIAAGDFGAGKGYTAGTHIAYDENNEFIYFCGVTNTIDLPLAAPIGLPTSIDAIIPFFAKLGADGFQEFSTYFAGGGESGDGTNVKVNSNGNVFFCGNSQNPIPTVGTAPIYQDSNGDGEGFIVEFDSNNTIVWATRFGRVGTRIKGMDVANNSLVIVGDFSSDLGTGTFLDFVDPNPLSTSDYFVTTVSGEEDTFIAKFDVEDNSRELVWSTLFGGNMNDSGEEVGLNPQGEVYFLGTTESNTPSFPTMGSNAVTINGGATDFFVARFSNEAELNYSGFFGGTNSEGTSHNNSFISPFDVDFDLSGNFYFTSTSNSSGVTFPITPFPGIYNQNVLGNDMDDDSKNDAVIVCLDKDMDIRWSSFFGGRDVNLPEDTGDVGTGIAIAGERIFLTGYTKTDCPIKIPIVENTSANYFQNSIIQDDFTKSDDAFITVFTIGSLTNTNNELLLLDNNHFNIYPNPSSNYLIIENLESIQGKVNITINDLLGKQIYQDIQTFYNKNSQLEINVSDFESGYYILTLESENTSYSTKLIIQK